MIGIGGALNTLDRHEHVAGRLEALVAGASARSTTTPPAHRCTRQSRSPGPRRARRRGCAHQLIVARPALKRVDAAIALEQVLALAALEAVEASVRGAGLQGVVVGRAHHLLDGDEHVPVRLAQVAVGVAQIHPHVALGSA